MPFGSIEEWRACIGTSWCALGRPVKKRSCRLKYVGGRSWTVLSLHHVVTMLIILLLISIGLHKILGNHQVFTSKTSQLHAKQQSS